MLQFLDKSKQKITIKISKLIKLQKRSKTEIITPFQVFVFICIESNCFATKLHQMRSKAFFVLNRIVKIGWDLFRLKPRVKSY